MSPSGIYTQLTDAELAVLRADALAAMTSGRRTSLSGGQKSGTKQWQMTPQDMLLEIQYALRQRGALPARVTKTYMDTVNPPCPAQVLNEQV